VFQLVPQRFQREIGIATGVIGAIGGVGGFLLPILLGNVKQFSGSFAAGFAALGVFAICGAMLLRALVMIRQGWRLSWQFLPGREVFEVAELQEAPGD